MKKIKQFNPKTYKAKNSFSEMKADLIKKLYDDPKWRKYSRDFLEVNPKCYCCGAPATVTDHIIAHKGDVNYFWKEDNLLSLCFKCHNTITALFDRHTHQKYKEKLEWIARSRTINQITTRIKILPIK
jgi:5-methylcytosine-specific restriction endonuclease McrA